MTAQEATIHHRPGTDAPKARTARRAHAEEQTGAENDLTMSASYRTGHAGDARVSDGPFDCDIAVALPAGELTGSDGCNAAL
jgi:hypothetical protein